MNPILITKSLSKTYHPNGAAVRALREVDLALAPGEFVTVMGPSGCGKSTLLHLSGGLDRPTSGEVYLNGARVDTLSEAGWAVLRRRQVGFVFQFFNLIGNLTVADNIELPALLAGASSNEARRRRQALLADLSITDKADIVPSQLSGGEQQRVALARALINQPAVLLADEPTGNLDRATAQGVFDLMLELARTQGTAFVVVTHDASLAARCQRQLTLVQGHIEELAQVPSPV